MCLAVPGKIMRIEKEIATKEEIEDPSNQILRNGIDKGMRIYATYSVIVEEYEGKIWCESPNGYGTVYYISIPCTVTE